MEKIQSRKVGVAGGLINQLMGNNKSEPVVGEGATILWYSDRSAYEVVWVSDCGGECKIRKMTTEFVGSAYGDERYKYISDESNPVTHLEWNPKKGKWGSVTYGVQIIKSLRKKLYKEWDWDWGKHLPGGLSWEDLHEVNEDGSLGEMKLIKGVTKEYKNFSPVSVIFGVMEEYRDPHF